MAEKPGLLSSGDWLWGAGDEAGSGGQNGAQRGAMLRQVLPELSSGQGRPVEGPLDCCQNLKVGNSEEDEKGENRNT